ncbi:MAG: ABC-F family ATP-binding cassette domain-containing protein [Saprospiraceae bacterium]|nr:ABC-F family ATP-binding cassette domain-containing protein [Saprospiraceae bacterium]
MNYLSIEKATKSYGEKILFDDISLEISQGDKIALVAKNGSGKSTLLRVAAGLETVEGENSSVYRREGVRIGYLEQEPAFPSDFTIFDAALDTNHPMVEALKEYEQALLHPDDDARMQSALNRMEDLKAWDFEARVKEILTKLSIGSFDQRVGTLSGGQKKRLALAKLIIEDPEFLILDEPTNHLDLDMIEWLENYLSQPSRTIFMVTHDRYFLERVCSDIIELDRGQLFRYTGSYSDFLEKKTIRQEVQRAEQEKDRKLLRKELEWVNRMPKARGTKAKARVDAFQELKEKVGGRKTKDELQIDIKGQRLGKKILEFHYLSKSFADQTIVDKFSYKFKKGERIGIVGPNGVGKTTFLKLITQEIRPDSGKVIVGGNTVFGYFTQSGIQLEEDKRVLEVVRDIAEFIPMHKGQKLTAVQMLERFMFNRKQQGVYVSQLSGGERRRLYLLTVLMKNPNFLILDEPTNDLDIITLNVLEEFLMEFPGCMVIVTHDRYFMDKIVDHLFVFEGDGKIVDFNGNYRQYRVRRQEEEYERRRRAREEQKQQASSPPPKQKSGGLTYEQRKQLRRLEKEIEKLEKRKDSLTSEFNNPDLSPQKIEELSIELGDVKKEIEDKEMQWLELAEAE